MLFNWDGISDYHKFLLISKVYKDKKVLEIVSWKEFLRGRLVGIKVAIMNLIATIKGLH
jgi:hypothetical protein